MTVPQKKEALGDIMEAVIAKGDLNKLTPEERVRYYTETCKSLGLNPLTRPFEYIMLNNRLTLYARRDATDQLRKIHGISITIVSEEVKDGLLTVHVRAVDKDGREDEDLGVVNFPEQLRGEARANAVLKCVTKAKRRVTLSISGLGILDETEVEDIPAAAKRPRVPAANVMLNPQTGEISVAETEEPGATDAEPAPDQPAADSAGGGPVLSLEDMAREAASRGEHMFRIFYKGCSKKEQARVSAIGEELRELMNEGSAHER
jgi:hypothetical protein